MLLLSSLQVFWFMGIHGRCKLFQIWLKYKGFIKIQEEKNLTVPIKPMGIFPLAVLCQDFKWVFNLAKKWVETIAGFPLVWTFSLDEASVTPGLMGCFNV